MKNRTNYIVLSLKMLLVSLAAVLLASCSAGPSMRPSVISPPPSGPEPINIFPMDRAAIYHTIAPGETLWRISKMYDVDVETLRRVNRVRDVRDLEIGQRLYIPEASRRKDVITFYPSKKWKYIIIHHSATDSGNSEFFDGAHKNRGWQGIGYDFVIDNGTYGKDDGQIETTPRWIKQLDGAHCKAGGMNEKGIGICLVGNFSEDQVTAKQMRSLTMLVRKLQEYYNIPSNRVLGHSHVPGANTECPGTKFPWKNFKSSLK